jgi:hypothetical protein
MRQEAVVLVPDPTAAETVQRICGSLEVARDLTKRAGDLYLSQSAGREHDVIEGLVRAVAALEKARNALASQHAIATGPAA